MGKDYSDADFRLKKQKQKTYLILSGRKNQFQKSNNIILYSNQRLPSEIAFLVI